LIDATRRSGEGPLQLTIARGALVLVLLLTLQFRPASAEDLIGADSTAPPATTEDNAPALLTGALKKIRDSGAIAIGYRDASFPFSFVRQGGRRSAIRSIFASGSSPRSNASSMARRSSSAISR
jgi:hypothetical protein